MGERRIHGGEEDSRGAWGAGASNRFRFSFNPGSKTSQSLVVINVSHGNRLS